MNVWKIRDNLFIRGMFSDRPYKLQELKDLEIGTVICMLRKTDPDLKNLDWLTYANFPLPDTDYVKEEALWGAAFLASRELYAGKKVLIHCIAARDRAPTTAAVTLCLKEGISGVDAMAQVKRIKPTTFHNKAFVAYLRGIQANAD